ncbi:mechanosensitive ion channel family protein [Austwickia chelonae]|uniref:mechanosensitive ion channel family protein n=1 Tax=Austwickia chelonae TaxID=100225 RepID=UPI001F08784F|nr:mechanosensitive ion channel family protein [Austwickia chelonae]
MADIPYILPTNVLGYEMSWEIVVDWILGRGLTIVAIVIGATVLRWFLHRLIDRAVSSLVKEKRARSDHRETGADVTEVVVQDAPSTDPSAVPSKTPSTARRRHTWLRARALEGRFLNPERQRQRVETLGSVLRSIATVGILITAIFMVGDQLGLNMAPVIASAGFGGVALGFGAQSLVKDYLTGIFMLAEDQYGVGDFIDTGTAAGTVEEVTLRVTRLRDAQGVIWYIRNGEIVRVANKSQGWSTAIVDIPVAYDESPERVISVLTTAMQELEGDPEWEAILLEQPRVVGVEAVSGGTMSIRILAKCAPNEHWGVQREIRERGLTACAREGIRGPAIIPPYQGGLS